MLFVVDISFDFDSASGALVEAEDLDAVFACERRGRRNLGTSLGSMGTEIGINKYKRFIVYVSE